MGERVIPRVLAGKAMRVVGYPDVRHTWTFITDVARADHHRRRRASVGPGVGCAAQRAADATATDLSALRRLGRADREGRFDPTTGAPDAGALRTHDSRAAGDCLSV